MTEQVTPDAVRDAVRSVFRADFAKILCSEDADRLSVRGSLCIEAATLAHAAATADRERMVGALTTGLHQAGGWREVIAELDDYGVPEAVGKAMWAALDQIDRWKATARAALADEARA